MCYVVIDIADSFGDEVAAFEDSNLIGDVWTLALEATADDAFHHFPGFVVFVFLLEQYLGPGAILVELLVGNDACIPVGNGRQ